MFGSALVARAMEIPASVFAADVLDRPEGCDPATPLVDCYPQITWESIRSQIRLTFGPLYQVEPWLVVGLSVALTVVLLVAVLRMVFGVATVKVSDASGDTLTADRGVRRFAGGLLSIVLVLVVLATAGYVLGLL